jgi:hypothetical protein
MKIGYFQEHWEDHEGNPTGGTSSGRGFTISWQNGQLGRGNDRLEPNGAFVEDVLDAVIQRIEFYQNSKFACKDNQDALDSLYEAATFLDRRTKEREARQVEGTHKV